MGECPRRTNTSKAPIVFDCADLLSSMLVERAFAALCLVAYPLYLAKIHNEACASDEKNDVVSRQLRDVDALLSALPPCPKGEGQPQQAFDAR